ncbi:hypothetical protein [Streptomyces sp. NPDC050145]|uniref:hypothetical protein n=1 Tax=Streptomyces sp. NPDC050145 TaxID=3365602 RepID=UPI0037BAE38F
MRVSAQLCAFRLDPAACFGPLVIGGLVICFTDCSQDIVDAKVGDCVRIEDDGNGSAYVQPCEFTIPWDKAYDVVGVGSTFCPYEMRVETNDEGTKSTRLCLKERQDN